MRNEVHFLGEKVVFAIYYNTKKSIDTGDKAKYDMNSCKNAKKYQYKTNASN